SSLPTAVLICMAHAGSHEEDHESTSSWSAGARGNDRVGTTRAGPESGTAASSDEHPEGRRADREAESRGGCGRRTDEGPHAADGGLHLQLRGTWFPGNGNSSLHRRHPAQE